MNFREIRKPTWCRSNNSCDLLSRLRSLFELHMKNHFAGQTFETETSKCKNLYPDWVLHVNEHTHYIFFFSFQLKAKKVPSAGLFYPQLLGFTSCWSCYGFAQYVFMFIFRKSFSFHTVIFTWTVLKQISTPKRHPSNKRNTENFQCDNVCRNRVQFNGNRLVSNIHWEVHLIYFLKEGRQTAFFTIRITVLSVASGFSVISYHYILQKLKIL